MKQGIQAARVQFDGLPIAVSGDIKSFGELIDWISRNDGPELAQAFCGRIRVEVNLGKVADAGKIYEKLKKEAGPVDFSSAQFQSMVREEYGPEIARETEAAYARVQRETFNPPTWSERVNILNTALCAEDGERYTIPICSPPSIEWGNSGRRN
jgi:hypothetical protein